MKTRLHAFLRGTFLALLASIVTGLALGMTRVHAAPSVTPWEPLFKGIDLMRWTVPQGKVDMNSHRSWLNPLDWSAIVWTP